MRFACLLTYWAAFWLEKGPGYCRLQKREIKQTVAAEVELADVHKQCPRMLSGKP